MQGKKVLINFWHVIFLHENQEILQLFFTFRYRSDQRPFPQLLPFMVKLSFRPCCDFFKPFFEIYSFPFSLKKNRHLL